MGSIPSEYAFVGMQPLTRDFRLDEVLEQVQATTLGSCEYSSLKETIDGLASQLDSTSSQWVPRCC